MAAVSNKLNYKRDLIIEFNFRDTVETYQLWLDENCCIVKDKAFVDPTTKITTSSEV